jgi:hypothetical protein
MREQTQDELAHRVGAGSQDILRPILLSIGPPEFLADLVSVSSARSARAALRGFAQGAVQVVNFLICGAAENFAGSQKG